MPVEITGVVSVERVRLDLGPAAHREVVVARLRVEPFPDRQWLHLYGFAPQHVDVLTLSLAAEPPRFDSGGAVFRFSCDHGNCRAFVGWSCRIFDDTNGRSEPDADPTREVDKVDALLEDIDRMLDA
jgi:hypothetical protein